MYYFSDKPGVYKRIQRLCPFCKMPQSKLSRHLKTVHRDSAEVQRILSLPKSHQRQQFALIRNRGIAERNREAAATKNCSSMEKIKKSAKGSETVHCSKCHGSYSRAYFYRHRKTCKKLARPILSSVLPYEKEESEGFLNILSSFQATEAGNLCRDDPTIRAVGKHLYLKDRSKVDKTDEVRKSVMGDMRNLAHLNIAFKEEVQNNGSTESSDVRSMFTIEKWSYLREAVDVVTSSNNAANIKYGLKNNLYYLLQRSADILIGDALAKHDGEEEVKGLNKFVTLLRHNQNSVFGDSKYLINKARQERLRLPSRQPPEDKLMELRLYTINRIQFLVTEELTSTLFVELRNLACSRLTLFNARRGGEPCRMITENWTDREKWRGRMQINPDDGKLFRNMDVTYITGKGNHLVSILVPKDTSKALDILANKTSRDRAGIPEENTFLFPNVGSCRHVGGWDATDTVLKKSKIDCPLINATNQRGRASTVYASFEVPSSERELFYKHMGHSADVNAGTYQRPLPVLTVTKVGKFLTDLDRGVSTFQCMYFRN